MGSAADNGWKITCCGCSGIEVSEAAEVRRGRAMVAVLGRSYSHE